MRRLAATLVTALALPVAGCGIDDPQEGVRARQAVTPAASTVPGMAPPSPDDPAPPAVPLDVKRLARTAREAIMLYIGLAGNWDSRTIARRYRAAMTVTTDAARADAERIAAEIPNDPRYAKSRIRQRTRLEGIAPRGGREYIVVTRRVIEMRDAQPSQAWVVTLATVREHEGRWVLERWEEQT